MKQENCKSRECGKCDECKKTEAYEQACYQEYSCGDN
jgi:hypothetical protein